MKKVLVTTILSIILGSQVVFAQIYPGTAIPYYQSGVTQTQTTDQNTSNLPPDASDLDYRLLEPLPFITKYETQGVGVNGEPITIYKTDLPTYVQGMYRLALVVGTVLAIFMVIVGGFKYVTSVIPNVKLDGKADIQNALIGLAWLFGSVLLIEVINPQLTTFTKNIIPSLNIQKVTFNTTGMTLAQYDESSGRLNTQINELRGALQRAQNDEERTTIQSQLNGLYEQRGRIQVMYNLQQSIAGYSNSLWSLNGNNLGPEITATENRYLSNNTLGPVINENTRIADENNLPALTTLINEAAVVNNNLTQYMTGMRILYNEEVTAVGVANRSASYASRHLALSDSITDPNLRSFYIKQVNSFRNELERRIATRDCLRNQSNVTSVVAGPIGGAIIDAAVGDSICD